MDTIKYYRRKIPPTISSVQITQLKHSFVHSSRAVLWPLTMIQPLQPGYSNLPSVFHTIFSSQTFNLFKEDTYIPEKTPNIFIVIIAPMQIFLVGTYIIISVFFLLSVLKNEIENFVFQSNSLCLGKIAAVHPLGNGCNLSLISPLQPLNIYL